MNTNQIINNIMSIYINDDIISKIDSKQLNYNEYINIYNIINKKLDKENISIYDINNFLLKENKKNEKIHKFIKHKNKKIIIEAYKSDLWKENINNLNQISKLNKKKIEQNYINLFKIKYSKNWNGYWTSININSRGRIININTIDIDDINYIIK